MASPNGQAPSQPLELSEVLRVTTKDGGELSFEVVGILEDPDKGETYAVLLQDPDDEEALDEPFIVTDMQGHLLEDDELAQDVLDGFLVFTEEAGDDGGGKD